MKELQAIEAEVVESDAPTDQKRKKHALAKRQPQSIAKAPAAGSIEDLMVRAVEQGNMDVIERVFALSEKVNADRARKAFFDALSRFQSLVSKIPKTKKGYGYSYAPLGTIEAVIAKPMEASGLSKRWRQEEPTPDSVKMICVVSHGGGHSEETTIGPVPWDLLERTERMNGLQHRGAVITYLQRYTLIGALGLATADDDPDGVIPKDARAAKATQPVRQPQAKPTAQEKEKAQKASDTRAKLTPAAEPHDFVPESTLKLFRKKMDAAALSTSDFTKRFGIEIEQIRVQDLNSILAWVADPQNK